MKVLFVGSKNMGASALECLVDLQAQGWLEIVGVVARDDDDTPSWYRSVSAAARQRGLPLFMPKSLNDASFLDAVRVCKPDLGLCCFFPKLFKPSFFEIPVHGFYNMHFAPLPRYRGAYPIPFAMIAGERQHGVTVHRITAGMDSGAILAQCFVPIHGEDTAFDVYSRCEQRGIALFQDTVSRLILAGGRLPLREQRAEDVISHVKRDMASLEMSKEWPEERVVNFVRAFDFPPFPLPFMSLPGGKVRYVLRPDRHGLDTATLEPVTLAGRVLYRTRSQS